MDPDKTPPDDLETTKTSAPGTGPASAGRRLSPPSAAHVPVSLEKLAPRRSLAAFRSRVDSVPLNNVGDRGPGHPMAEVVERTLDACVTPAWILASHSDNQVGDDLHYLAPTRRAAFVSPLLGNQLSVPTKDRVGRDERSDFGEGAAADGFAVDSKSATLIIGQSESSATELLLEDSVLFTEILDDRILLASDPSGYGGYEDLPRLKNDGHPVIVARPRSIRQLSLATQVGLFFPRIGSAEKLDSTRSVKPET